MSFRPRFSALFSVPLLLSLTAVSVVSAAPAARAQSASTASIDSDLIAKIRDEGMNRSQVLDTLAYLTDVIGPRLTASPGLKRANEWTKTKLTGWGLQNARLEGWGPFGMGWELERYTAQVTGPVAFPLISFPKAWSPGLKSPLNADVVYVDATDEAGLQKYKGKLKGKIVLTMAMRPITAHFEPQGARYTDEALAALAQPPGAGGGRRGGGAPGGFPGGGRPQMSPEQIAALQFGPRRAQFIREEGAALLVDAGRGDGGTLFIQSATVPAAIPAAGAPAGGGPGAGGGGQRTRVSPWDKGAESKMTPQISLSAEHYNRLLRMVQAGEPVKMLVDFKARFTDLDNGMSFNTVAEIPGSDPTLKNEIVMVGGHMDSWHSGTGATDNGAGCAVGMEAVRIIKALGLKPRRTIRIALWSGEEQGLFGSRAYVQQHKDEWDKISAYFNLDNGTGKIRGVYCQGNEGVMPIFAEWLKPFADLGATTVTVRNTGGTDHQSFDAVGIPGFQFIQDAIEYDSRTHHSNQDTFDRIQGDDMKQASVIMATFLMNTANRDEKLPRKAAPTAGN